ncbi:hypothetical protein H4F99_01540 [Lysobacter sp. SG-8]|uniref:Uncharacterized protein n=1 Tax=Marilutibacter penaei TaxID=2759900 RepID=A0A7W3YDE1_9GAMM|nr:hypothetical protein [Lysobacter penaei]MBB1087165.1 hypothetical protein [Lysobacter penaei]
MNVATRRIAGWLCVGLGFALVVALGLGVIGPTLDGTAPVSLAAVFAGLAPTLMMAVGAFVVGLVLLRGGRSR